MKFKFVVKIFLAVMLVVCSIVSFALIKDAEAKKHKEDLQNIEESFSSSSASSSEISFLSEKQFLEATDEIKIVNSQKETKAVVNNEEKNNSQKKLKEVKSVEEDSLINVLLKYFDSKDSDQLVIDQELDGYAQGEFGQQWWLAAQAKSKWKVVVTGYSYVNCSDISSYDFPVEMVPSCWSDRKNNLIDR